MEKNNDDSHPLWAKNVTRIRPNYFDPLIRQSLPSSLLVIIPSLIHDRTKQLSNQRYALFSTSHIHWM